MLNCPWKWNSLTIQPNELCSFSLIFAFALPNIVIADHSSVKQKKNLSIAFFLNQTYSLFLQFNQIQLRENG